MVCRPPGRASESEIFSVGEGSVRVGNRESEGRASSDEVGLTKTHETARALYTRYVIRVSSSFRERTERSPRFDAERRATFLSSLHARVVHLPTRVSYYTPFNTPTALVHVLVPYF